LINALITTKIENNPHYFCISLDKAFHPLSVGVQITDDLEKRNNLKRAFVW